MKIARTGPSPRQLPPLESRRLFVAQFPPRQAAGAGSGAGLARFWNTRFVHPALVVAALLLISAGCGPQSTDDENRTTVSGTVTFNGKPLPAGTITFQSIDKGIGTPTSIRAGGRYATDRAPIGENAVIIETDSIQYGNPGAYVPIPAKYADPAKSDLRVVVEPGENEDVDFALTG